MNLSTNQILTKKIERFGSYGPVKERDAYFSQPPEAEAQESVPQLPGYRGAEIEHS